MITEKYYCDVCKNEVSKNAFVGAMNITFSTGGKGTGKFESNEICYDCCTKIHRSIEYIRNVSKLENNKEAKV